MIKQHSQIVPNLKKNLLINFIRLIKYLLKNLFLRDNSDNIESNYILSFGEKNKIKFNKNDNKNYLDYPSFWLRFNSKPKKRKIITYIDETLDYSDDQFLFKDKAQKKNK